MRDLFDPMRFPGIENELCLGIFELTINLLQFSLFCIFHIGDFITLVKAEGTELTWFRKTLVSSIILNSLGA